jgi:uncharacterized membrane protein
VATSSKQARKGVARRRMIIMFAGGAIAAAAVGLTGLWPYAPTIGWAVSSLIYLVWVWLTIGRMDAERTSSHATREDPARGTSDLLCVIAAVASILALGLVLAQPHSTNGSDKIFVASLAIVSLALSWCLVHTLYTMRYAMLYYTKKAGGVDFNQDAPPAYADSAYLSFTIGMTYQVSDTNLKLPSVRVTALRQALLSYLFGAVILAAAVNLVVGIASGS